MRIAAGIEYDGSQYHGWQAQKGLRTIQQVIETALSKIADCPVKIICAGRTDTGVHATNQVIHFDTLANRNIRSWIFGVNSLLPKDICIRWAKEVPETFNARFSALSRRYKYVVYNNSIRTALCRSNVTWQYQLLDTSLMHEAAQYLLGEHNFTSYRSVECQSKTPMRNIHKIDVKRSGDLAILDVVANAFLHHMIRNIMGVLLTIGVGKKSPSWSREVLEAKNRSMGAETAPPYGLYLVNVYYPKIYDIKFHNVEPLILRNIKV